jgi:hypothetical protein
VYNFRDPQAPLAPEQSAMRKAVLKQIEYDPKSFNMGSWQSVPTITETSCHTTRCLAGWAEFLATGKVQTGEDFSDKFHERIGIELLGLTSDEYYRGDGGALFFAGHEEALERMRKIADG